MATCTAISAITTSPTEIHVTAERIGMTRDGTAQVVIEATVAQADGGADERIASAEPARPKPKRRPVDEG